jgi:hypothetical protein
MDHIYEKLEKQASAVARCQEKIENVEDAVKRIERSVDKISKHLFEGNGKPPVTVRLSLLEENHIDHGERIQEVEKKTGHKWVVALILGWLTCMADLFYQTGIARAAISLFKGE